MDSHQLALAFTIAIVVVVILTVASTAGDAPDRLCEERAGGGFEYVDRPTDDMTTWYCDHPNGTVREVSNLVNSTA